MGIKSLSSGQDKKKIDSRYRLVEAVIKRAKELHNGEIPRVANLSKGITSVALEEVTSGAVRVLSGQDAVLAKEKKGKQDFQGMMDEAKQKASLPEEMTKIEKDLQIFLRDKESTVDENTS